MYYVYRITNIICNKHYYGVRKSINPNDDLGIIYFSSSSDIDFIKDQKLNPSHYKYKVILSGLDKNKAYKLEYKLHNKFEVGINQSFYNKAKATSSAFNCARLGTVPVKNNKTGETSSVSREEFESNEDLVHVTKGTAVAINIETGETRRVSPEEFAAGNYRYVNTGKIQSDESNKKRSDTIKSLRDVPWRNPKPKKHKKILDVYAVADKIYDVWVDREYPGIHKLRKFTGVHIPETILYNFREGWIPIEDNIWVSDFENYVSDCEVGNNYYTNTNYIIIQYDMQDNIIQQYDSQAVAARETGADVSACVTGKQLSSKGFKFCKILS